MFQRVSPSVNFPDVEREVLAFWTAQQIFRQSVTQRAGCAEFVFYDGPPFATGLPHYGHLLASTIKDVVPRYQTMRGHQVERVFGWDCHGLPVENEVEKSLGINSKHEIEALGVAAFNEHCRSIVLKYTGEWEQIINRLGRWVDFRHGYRTMDRDYMESTWWVFKQLWDKGLVYEGHKIMWYCPRCATPLSNFEVNQGYKEVEDPALTVRFQALDAPDTYYLAWTTTPWTLPANLALTVGPDIPYVEVEDKGTHYLLGEALVGTYFKGETPPTIVRRLLGRELAGRRYAPLFPYFAGLAAEGAFRVITADFVSTAEGTGIVHTAPGFGEDDAAAGKAHGVPAVCPIDDEGRYTAAVPDYTGRFVKDCDADIIKWLKHEKHLVHRGTVKHNYPHCWRCDAPLLNRAIATWFVRVEQLKARMLAANAQIHWVPDHMQAGRFGKWLENARDWAISRNRYWGCPLPIWRNKETGETKVFGSVAELEAACGAGTKLPDIHKHLVDPLVLKGANGTELKRVPEVLDCWFESGSMPYGQVHYPFAHREWLESHFPADFIAEGLDQTRGWFYTLVVLGAALFDKPAFKNVVVNGIILSKDGEKLSKRLKNYPDPLVVMDTYGADALRLCLLSSPLMRADDLRFSEEAVKESMRGVLIPLWNAYSFLVTYANVDGWDPATAPALPAPAQLANPLDHWILSQAEGLVARARACLDDYDLQGAAQQFTGFIDNLTNWYIRLSRRRFWKSQDDADKAQAYATLYQVLLTCVQTAAPFVPFITDAIYRNLRTAAMPASVHLCDYPAATTMHHDAVLDRRMERAQVAVSLGRSLRKTAKLNVRQPLRAVVLVSMDAEVRADLADRADLIASELNVKAVRVEADETPLVHLTAKANFRLLGPKFGPRMKLVAAAIAALPPATLHRLQAGEEVPATLSDGTTVAISKDFVDLRREERAGLAVANKGDITVALELALDEELELEGHARELVHAVQELRKAQGLQVSDRIRLEHHLPAPLALALQRHQPYIANETLAVEFGALADPAGLAAIAVGDLSAYLRVAKAGGI